MTTTTAEKPTITIASITADAIAAAAALGEVTRRERRILVDQNLPQTDGEAEQHVSQFLDPLARLWSYAASESSLVEQGDAALAQAKETYEAARARLDGHATAPDTRPESIHEIRAREQQTAEIAALRKATAALGETLERAADPHHLVARYVATAIEVLLRLDRSVKIRRLRAVLERARQDIVQVRATADEHRALRATWETRLGRTFDITDLPQPIVKEK